MSWLSILLLVIRYLPAAISIIREIIRLIDGLRKSDAVGAAALRAKLEEAVDEAARTGSVGPLRRLLAQAREGRRL